MPYKWTFDGQLSLVDCSEKTVGRLPFLPNWVASHYKSLSAPKFFEPPTTFSIERCSALQPLRIGPHLPEALPTKWSALEPCSGLQPVRPQPTFGFPPKSIGSRSYARLVRLMLTDLRSKAKHHLTLLFSKLVRFYFLFFFFVKIMMCSNTNKVALHGKNCNCNSQGGEVSHHANAL